MRSKLAKIAFAAALVLAAAAPAACGAIAVPGQDPLRDSHDEDGYGNTDVSFGLPSERAGRQEGQRLSPVNAVIKRGLQVVAGVSVLMIVWAGYLYLTSYGEEEKVKKAKKAILWTVLGLVTGLGGWAVVDLINNLSLNVK